VRADQAGSTTKAKVKEKPRRRGFFARLFGLK
jgi:hypothetical protein